jgi:FMN-dependent NADH-azoreductase
MSDLMVKVHNVETGEIIEREMNAQELAQYDKEQAEAQASATKQAEAKAAKEAAEAKLAALGLTADDLKALGLGNN